LTFNFVVEGQKTLMRYCEMELQGPVLALCNERGSINVEGHWFCQHHAAALAQAEERWSGVNWFSLTEKNSKKKPDLNDEDGRYWDEEDED
jgi:hypothetical protein